MIILESRNFLYPMLEESSWSQQRLVYALEALSSMEHWVVEVFSPSSPSELEELMVPYSGAADSRDWELHALQWSLMIKSSYYYPQCWKILLQLPLQRLIRCVASFAPEHKTSVCFNLRWWYTLLTGSYRYGCHIGMWIGRLWLRPRFHQDQQLPLRLPYWHVNRAAVATVEISSGPKRLSCSWMPSDAWTALMQRICLAITRIKSWISNSQRH